MGTGRAGGTGAGGGRQSVAPAIRAGVTNAEIGRHIAPELEREGRTAFSDSQNRTSIGIDVGRSASRFEPGQREALVNQTVNRLRGMSVAYAEMAELGRGGRLSTTSINRLLTASPQESGVTPRAMQILGRREALRDGLRMFNLASMGALHTGNIGERRNRLSSINARGGRLVRAEEDRNSPFRVGG